MPIPSVMRDWDCRLTIGSTPLMLAAAKHRCYAVSVGPEQLQPDNCVHDPTTCTASISEQ